VLRPPATSAGRVCDFEGMNGICVTGEFTPDSEEIGTPVRDVTVTGLSVRGFPRFGVLVNNAVDVTVSGNEASGSGSYGVIGVFVTHIHLLENSSHDNHEGGFYLDDSPQANAVVAGNRSYKNRDSAGFGLFIRDASHGVVRGNRFEGNCAGMALVGMDGAGSTTGWTVRDNVVSGNTFACSASDPIPALSGLGIALIGTSRTRVSENTVTGNYPTGDTAVAGGIAVVSAQVFGGPDPEGNVVTANRVRRNAPADLVYDGSGRDNRLVGNDCGASLPDGLCG
jgi:nitrous oxidase accessory protein NosD